MTPEEDAARQKVEVLARHLDAAVVNALASTFAGNEADAIASWDRALTLALALESLSLEPVDPILQATAARLAAWEDVEEGTPGEARLLRRHRAPGRAKRPTTALHRIVAASGKACAAAIVARGAASEDERRLLVRALGAVLAPGRLPPADEASLAELATDRVVDWQTAELLGAAGISPPNGSK